MLLLEMSLNRLKKEQMNRCNLLKLWKRRSVLTILFWSEVQNHFIWESDESDVVRHPVVKMEERISNTIYNIRKQDQNAS